MRVRIVCYEDVDNWILGKIVLRLKHELEGLGVEADIGKIPDSTADINHHVIYLDYACCGNQSVDTLMITHVDAHWKLRKLKKQLSEAALGICMSSDTMRMLAHAGIPAERLCFVNPAHDGCVTPRPFRVGITTRIYPDGRKREGMLLKLAQKINSAEFSFAIMGDGWTPVVAELKKRGFAIEYYPSFDPEMYRELILSLDYYLYLGSDEGSMGFIDALAAGVPTIATPQGFHLDAPGGLTYSFETEEDLFTVFEKIAAEKRGLVRSVAMWTWQHYAIKHLQIWQYLLTGSKPLTHDYLDGIVSLGQAGEDACPANSGKAVWKLICGSVRGIIGTLRSRKADHTSQDYPES